MTSAISSIPRNALQRSLYSVSPGANFSAEFQANFAKTKEAMQAGAQDQADEALSQTLGQTQMESAQRLSLDKVSEYQFAALLDKAYANKALDDPQAFLKTLDAGELEQLRVQHGLGDSIKVDGLSREGAANLLLPKGYSVDLNADGIVETGIGKLGGFFPPRDAPDALKTAWFTATDKMSEGDVMTYGLTMHDAVYGVHIGDALPPVKPTDQMSTYRDFVANYLAAIKKDHSYMQPGQYEHVKSFFERFGALMNS